MREEVKNWWKQAERDFLSTQKNLSIEEFHLTVFLCQHSVEKGLKALYIHAKKQYFDPMTHSPKVIENVQKTWLTDNTNNRGLIAYYNEEPIGYCSYRISIGKYPACGLIDIFGVLPFYRRRNFGKEMLYKVHRELIKEGNSYTFVGTSEYNLPAQHLYCSMGYESVYRITFFHKLNNRSTLEILKDNK